MMTETKRAHRIEVDMCGDLGGCPFYREHTGVNSARCDHPDGGGKCTAEFEVGKLEFPCPTTCPLRGALTMVAGPAAPMPGEELAGPVVTKALADDFFDLVSRESTELDNVTVAAVTADTPEQCCGCIDDCCCTHDGADCRPEPAGG